MDTSNPVMNSDRVTVGEALERLRGQKRQKMEYLRELAQSATRVVLPEGELYPPNEVRTMQTQFLETIPKVSSEKTSGLDPNIFELVSENLPVCGLLNADGVPIHPSGINSSAGSVCVSRQMGSVPARPEGLLSILEALGPEVLDRQHVYTSGTWEGFTARLAQQMGRKTVSLYQTVAMSQGLRKPVSAKIALDALDKLMPRRPNTNWPGVHTSLEDALFDGIKITSSASAGAPYWRHKGECLDDIVFVGLPIIVEAIKNNTLNQLSRENPELFLVEVKNKLDRYKISELNQKTRPYVCVPAHWAFLFSMLTQGFQETLQVFDTNPGCSNAYGFSSADGGLERMVSWMESADRRGKVVCYGDDACIVVRRPDGVYRVDPDFKQMDGSIHADDVDLTIRWILRHLRKDLGEDTTPHFWKGVADVWKVMATNPNFIVDGKKIWRKKSGNGLMTGVPGTTLFDTVKSVLAWNCYLDMCHNTGKDPLDGKFATQTMAQWGLVIKPGTWNPARVPEAVPGNLMTDHKFLGVQILCAEWRGRTVFVPAIPREEAIEMMVVQKDNPFDKKRSVAQRQRTLYDRMRGMMLTFGFVHPDVVHAIHHVVNSLDPAVIIMQVQSGTGERPEHILMDDFVYPDSAGFPGVDFCFSVYAGGERESWVDLFPDLSGRLRSIRLEARQALREFKVVKDQSPHVIHAVDVSVRPPDPVLGEAVAFQPVQLPGGGHNPRSKILRVESTKTKVEEKFIPPRGESIRRWLSKHGEVAEVHSVLAAFSMNMKALEYEAQKYGLFVTEFKPDGLVSLSPLIGPMSSQQSRLTGEWEKQRDLVDRGTVSRQQALVAANTEYTHVRTAPNLVMLDQELLTRLEEAAWKVDFPDLPPRWLRSVVNEEQALAGLNVTLGTLYGSMSWRTLDVRPNETNPVGVTLTVGPPDRKQVVAEAWSVSKKLAQLYIARSIFEINGLGFPTDRFSVSYLPPPDISQGASWVEEMEYNESPKHAPQVQGMRSLGAYPRALDGKLPELDHDQKAVLWAAVCARHPDNPMHYVELMVGAGGGGGTSPTTSSGVEMSPPPSPSKRRSTPQKRAQENRRLYERRKKKMKASSSPSL
nr:MAG: RdRP [Nodaviridae sp.]